MNREIKFRAFARAEKKIYTISKIDFEFQSLFLLGKNGSFGGFLCSEVELMQFTGLYDKHGKEIYEGDIIPIFSKNEVVIFKNGMFCVKDRSLHRYITSLHLEVIGNIYENPELLKQ